MLYTKSGWNIEKLREDVVTEDIEMIMVLKISLKAQ